MEEEGRPGRPGGGRRQEVAAVVVVVMMGTLVKAFKRSAKFGVDKLDEGVVRR